MRMKQIFTILIAAVLSLSTAVAQMELASSGGAQSVAFSPNGGGEAYMSIANMIYKSTDGGDTWGTTPVYAHAGGIITKIDFLPGSGNLLYFSVNNSGDLDNSGFYKYDVNFEELTDIVTGSVVTNFDIISSSNTFLLSDLVNGENYKYDGVVVSPILTGVKAFNIQFTPGNGWTNPDRYYGTTAEGIWLEDQWSGSPGTPNLSSTYGTGIGYTSMGVLTYDAGGYMSNYFIFGQMADASNDGNLRRFDPAMWSWNENIAGFDVPTKDHYPRKIRVHTNEDTVFVGEYNEAAVSYDRGATWRTTAFTGATSVTDIAYNPNNVGEVLIACADGILRSTDTLITILSASTVPTPTTFGTLSFIIESGSTNDLTVGVADGDGVSTATVDGTVGDNFDISTAGVLSVKNGVTLVAGEYTGTITVTDNNTEVTTAVVSVIVMDQVDATIATTMFEVREKTLEDWPFVTGIEDANGIVSVEFDASGDLYGNAFFVIDNEGTINFDQTQGSPTWNFTYAVYGDTLKQDLVVTDILGGTTIVSVTIVIDALPVITMADYQGNVFLETYTDVVDTFELGISDMNGLASVTIGGPVADLYEIDGEGTLTLKEGVTLEIGNYEGFIKMVDNVGHVYFNNNFGVAVMEPVAPWVYKPLEMQTMLVTNFYWNSWSNAGHFNGIYNLITDNTAGIESAVFVNDGDPATADIDTSFNLNVNTWSHNINLYSLNNNWTAMPVGVDTIYGGIQVTDTTGQVVTFNIKVAIHSNVGSIGNTNAVVESNDTAATVNMSASDNDGIASVVLEGDVTNFFTVDLGTNKLVQIPGTNLGENNQMNITGTATLTDDLGEVVTGEYDIEVNYPMSAPDTVTEYVPAGVAVQKRFEYSISDLNGFKSFKYYAYTDYNADAYTHHFSQGDTLAVIEYYEAFALELEDTIHATYQFKDNSSDIQNFVFKVVAVSMEAADFVVTVNENTTDNQQLVITPASEVASIVLAGDVANYYDVDATGLMTLKAGAELDYEVTTEITGTYTVTDARSGHEYVANITITLNDLDDQTSVNESELNAVSVYPNPASEFVFISNAEGAQVTVFNSLGAVVDSFTANSESFEYNTSNLSTGLYIIHVNNGSAEKALRISIVK
jgi:hypothetical protein